MAKSSRTFAASTRLIIQRAPDASPITRSANLRICRFDLPELDSLPDDLKEQIHAVQDKAGFVPNVFRVLARRPEEFRAFFAYHDALMLRKGGLSKSEKEMIVVATSAANDCQYCVVAHGAILRIYEKNPYVADQIAINYHKADISARQHAMLSFALKVATESASVNEEDFEIMKSHGFDDDDIWDVGSITALFALSNRFANFTSMRPNEEFFGMGRQPAR